MPKLCFDVFRHGCCWPIFGGLTSYSALSLLRFAGTPTRTVYREAHRASFIEWPYQSVRVISGD